MEQRFDLEVSADRPILRLDYLFPGCTALIDTGALFPVWTKNRELLEALGAKMCKRNVGLVVLAGMLMETFIHSRCSLAV